MHRNTMTLHASCMACAIGNGAFFFMSPVASLIASKTVAKASVMIVATVSGNVKASEPPVPSQIGFFTVPGVIVPAMIPIAHAAAKPIAHDLSGTGGSLDSIVPIMALLAFKMPGCPVGPA